MSGETRSSTRRFAGITAAAVAFSLLFCCDAQGGRNVVLLLEPSFGGSWVTLKALEIDKSFLTSAGDDGEDDDWQNVDPSSVKRGVGRKAYYEGSGFSLGGTAGIELFNLIIGFVYEWDSVTLDGFSKKYRYEPDALRAGGRKFWDEGAVDLQRVMVRIGYSLPIWRLRLRLQTRLGALYMDEGPLIVGRAIDESSGFAGDVGIGLGFQAFTFLTIGLDGRFGFYTFSGAYEGAYGTLAGLVGTIGFHL